jgi:hypothetical protein
MKITTTMLKECQEKRAQGYGLKQIAAELNVPWQRVYSALKAAGSDAPQKAKTPAEIPASVERAVAATRDENGFHRVKHLSITDAVQDALRDYATNETNREHVTGTQNKALTGNNEWGNYYTPEKFNAALQSPPQELLDAVTQLKDELVGELALPTQARRRVRRGLDHGDEITADRWLDRDPNCWERSVRELTTRQVVKLAVNLTVCGLASPKQLLYRGAAALALADVLTERGHNVEITLFGTASRMTPAVNVIVSEYVVKATDMPLDIGALTFAACEVAFFRIIVACGTARHVPGTLAPHRFGPPAPLPSAIAEPFDFVVDNDVISRSAAKAWLDSKLSAATN